MCVQFQVHLCSPAVSTVPSHACELIRHAHFGTQHLGAVDGLSVCEGHSFLRNVRTYYVCTVCVYLVHLQGSVVE